MATTALSHWSTLSPYGRTHEDFRAGFAAGGGRTAVTGTVPGFDIRGTLGKAGTRSMDRVTALAVAAIGNLMREPGVADLIGPDSAIVLGTTAGSVASTMRFTRDSLTEERPYLVDPARFPNTVMNCAAGRSAIWHKLAGPNATVAGGAAAGLFALNYARRLLDTGRADTVVVGAAEELSAERSRIHPHTAGDTGAPLSEGAAVFLMSRAGEGARPGAELLAPVRSRVVAREDLAAAIGPQCAATLARAGVTAGEVDAIACVGPVEIDDAVRAALPAVGAVLRPQDHIGDTGAAQSAFAVGMLAARGGSGIGLVLAYDENTLATAALRYGADAIA
ncbi:beta-ketoacyl synthase N-terminal-like domain-containing protein [Nocardia arizonensis]|uniref:beta-ketoacyl synthase N-terminal-like domain-containing protein n=1 Tax=Nocardia arizonensis TaxID=1141647 RepID=UPI0006D11456|nr:beta-ketoacyl synthase N-terminal-like domain-containing protein [Nocardia arizonensis]